jgi:hypothetical protein
MMHIVYFSGKSQFLAEMQEIAGEKKIISPSPAKADALRSMLIESSQFDVVTISKFTSDLMKSLWGENQSLPLKRKAELILIFGILKDKYFPELGYEQFNQAYNLFSDLRSFTLNEDALTSVLDEQSPEIRKAIQIFWKLLEVTGFLDEHGAYQKITEELRSAEEKGDLKKTYIFWGFSHLNGQQVDLLKALSIRYDVIIPFPLVLKEKLKRTDWLSWLKDSKVHERELMEIPLAPKGTWLRVNSREMSMNLKQLIKSGDQIVLGVSKLSPLHLDIVPSKEVSYKIPHQLVQAELHQLSFEIKSNLSKVKNFSQLEEFLLTKKQMILSAEVKDFPYKRLKAIELYQEAILEIRELTDAEVPLSTFMLKLMNEVVALNQPRTSYVPLSPVPLTIDLKDMSSLEDVKRDRRVILCVDDRFEEIQGLGQNYSESIQKSLSALGPLKRSELELLFKQWEFHDLCSGAELLVLMSQATLKHSLIWKRLFADVQLSDSPFRYSKDEKKITDYFQSTDRAPFSGSFSASKFQTYVDCPRKFYFNYVDKVFPTISLKTDFDSLTSGTISHRIIELFHDKKLKTEELPHLTKQVMQEFITKDGLNLSIDKMLKHELVFNQRSMNGIQFLQKINELLGVEVHWKIEEEFSLTDQYQLNGKIDCLGTIGKITFLLDFKSTKFAASSNKDVEQFESLQLWAYAKAAAQKIENFANQSVVMGFISLDNPSESNLLFSDIDLYEKFKASRFCRVYLFKDPFKDIFQSAQEKMLSVAQAIGSETIYPARPKKNETCKFCELNKVCIKSEIPLE